MSSIFGYTGNQSDLKAMEDKLAHWSADRKSSFQSDSFNTGVLELFKTPECEFTPQPVQREDVIVALDGRIDNRDELIPKLNFSKEQDYADVDFVLHAYKKWGKDCLSHLVGAFVFSIWDKNSETLFIARDQMGVKPLYYSVVGEELVFASEMKGILAVKGFDKTLNDAYVTSLFSVYNPESDQSLYQNILKLPAGCYLTFKNKEVEVTKYWYLGKNKPTIPKTVKEQVELFGKLFEQSVQRRLRTKRNLGAEVSGGLDSTGIAAFAMKSLGKGHPFYSYCYGMASESTAEDDQKDDSELVVEFCKNYKINEYLTVANDKDLSGEDYLKYNTTILDDIDENGVPMLATSFLPKAEKQEVNVMLSGWAGDQIVTSTVGGLYEAIANKRLPKKLWKSLRHQYGIRKSFVRWIYYLTKQLYNPLLKQYLKKGKEDLEKGVLAPRLIEKYNVGNIPSLRFYLKSCIDIQEYQLKNISHGGIENRTVQHGLIGKHFKIDYRFPMLDVTLLEYIHQLPFSTTAPKGQTRYLFKQLIKGMVPNGVIDMHKSFVPTTPFSRYFFDQNDELFAQTVKEEDLKHLEGFLKLDNYQQRNNSNKNLKIIQLARKSKP